MTKRNVFAGVFVLWVLFQGAPRLTAVEYDPFADGAEAPGKSREGLIASMEFVDAPITTVFRIISDLTGWSIVMSPELSKSPPKINLWIKNLSPSQVLDRVAEVGGVVLERQGTTVNVMSFDEYVRKRGVSKQVVQLRHASAEEVVALLKPFAEEADRARILADKQGNRIVLLVPAPLLRSFVKLIGELDQPLEGDVIRIVRLKHLEAREVKPSLEGFLAQGIRAGPRAPTGSSRAPEAEKAAGENYIVKFMEEPKLNALVLRGSARDVGRAAELISQLDVPQGIVVRSYRMRFTDVREVFDTLRQVLSSELSVGGGGGSQGRLQLGLSEQNGRIVVEGSKADHQRIAALIDAIDRPLPPNSGGIRVYRLENISSADVVKVIQSLIDQREGRASELDQAAGKGGEAGSTVPQPKAPADRTVSSETAGSVRAKGNMRQALVTEAPEINAVIIKASAAEHEEFAKVIREMDKPRDQLMLEMTLVTVRSDETFDLGLEVGGATVNDSGVEAIGFTTFGIGVVDSSTGRIRIAEQPGFGANVAVFNAEDFSLVLNALRTVGEVRITSAPRILVEDNTEAEITQISQEPYEVTSQGSETTVTSFGGFVDAGTMLTVTPHLSEHEWLRLAYSVTLSSFGTRSASQIAANLPPPRRQNNLRGTVRVPSDHMVAIGGLVASRTDEMVNSVPYLSEVPLIGELFKSRSNSRSNETLYVFIRPVVLRDPAFKDLLFLSDGEIRQAKLDGRLYPVNPLKRIIPWSESEEEGELE